MSSQSSSARARLLQERHLIGGPEEERFERIVRLAARLIGAPVAHLNVLDDSTTWTKAAVGSEQKQLPVGETFCQRVIETQQAVVIEDLRTDTQFRDYALVTEKPHFRFYAGEPLSIGDEVVGTLCVLDTVPRQLTPDQRELLRELASWAQSEVDNAGLNELVGALQDRESRLATLLDAVPEAVLLVDEKFRLTPTNPAGRTLLPSGTSALRDVFPLLSPDAPPFLERRGEGGAARLPVETTLCTPDQRVPVEVSVAPLGLSRAPWRWLVLVRDLSDLAQADAALRRERRLTSLILDSTTDGIVGSTTDGTVFLANRAATAMLTCRSGDLVGHSFQEVARPAADEQGQMTLSRRDGSRFPVELATTPIQVGEEVVGSVDTFRDVSQRLEMDRLKDEFVGVVSHELRTPLTSIKGALGLLSSGAFGDFAPEQAQLIDLARSNADRLGFLVDDILDLDRLDAGRMPLNAENVDVVELARQSVDSLDGAARAAGVTLQLLDEAGAADVSADPMRLVQALCNLIGNAIKFSEVGDTVVVRVSRDDAVSAGSVTVAVTDSGPGISQDQQRAVFDRFHQVNPADRGSRKGSGLGLSVAKGIVERSGGQLWLRSTKGQGSTFGVTLPALTTPRGREAT
ncbi:MAG: ATP-binding protein [Actinomycetales bacterium]